MKTVITINIKEGHKPSDILREMINDIDAVVEDERQDDTIAAGGVVVADNETAATYSVDINET